MIMIIMNMIIMIIIAFCFVYIIIIITIILPFSLVWLLSSSSLLYCRIIISFLVCFWSYSSWTPLITLINLSAFIILSFNVSSCRCSRLSHTFAGNNTDVANVCRLVPSLLNKPHVFVVHLDHSASDCVVHAAWKGAGLPAPPRKVVVEGWIATLSFIRVRRVCAPFRKPLRSRPMFHHHAPHTSAC